MENAKLYATSNGMQKKDAREIFAEFREKLKWTRGVRILDVGCGSGDVTTEVILPHLPKDFKEVVGLDVSPEMIKHARSLNRSCRVTFVHFDIARDSGHLLKEMANAVSASKRLGLADGRPGAWDGQVLECRRPKTEERSARAGGFDIVFSFYCLHWVTNQKLAFKNIYKLLKPGGEALVAFLMQSPIFTLYKKMSKTAPWMDYMKDVDDFIPFYQDVESPEDEFAKIVKAAGFLILTSDCRERNYVFENFSSLRDAIVAVNPFLPRIPSSLRDDFINECLYQSQILNLTAPKNNCYRVSYKLMVAHVRKPEI